MRRAPRPEAGVSDPQQRTLFAPEDLAPAPRAHVDDPGTSRAAAAGARDIARRHGARVRAAIEQLGVATAEEIADRLGLTALQVMKRVAELLEARSVFVADENGRTRAGRRCRRYRLAVPCSGLPDAPPVPRPASRAAAAPSPLPTPAAAPAGALPAAPPRHGARWLAHVRGDARPVTLDQLHAAIADVAMRDGVDVATVRAAIDAELVDAGGLAGWEQRLSRPLPPLGRGATTSSDGSGARPLAFLRGGGPPWPDGAAGGRR
jgi:hypothetical protein